MRLNRVTTHAGGMMICSRYLQSQIQVKGNQKQGDQHSIGVRQSCLSPELNNSLQHSTNHAEQYSNETGSTQTTPTNHLHYETLVCTPREHINRRGTQFLAAGQCQPRSPMPLHAGTPTNSTYHQDYSTNTTHQTP